MPTLSMRKHPRLPLMRELSAKLTEGENIVSNHFLPLKAHRIVSQKIIPQFSFPRSHIFSQHLGQRDILFAVGFHVLSLRQKSKIFATSLIRGRLWCGANLALPLGELARLKPCLRGFLGCPLRPLWGHLSQRERQEFVKFLFIEYITIIAS